MYNKIISTKNDKEKKINSLKSSKNLIENSHAEFCLDNTFCLFKSIYNILYLIYPTHNLSIISYNLIDNKIINEIKNAHEAFITNFRHILDLKNKMDLIISISAEDKVIKLWNINDWFCLLNIENINQYGYLFSACFLKDNNNIYILTSNVFKNPEKIKLYDIKGKKINEINESNDNTYFIDVYHENYSENQLSDIYIITCNLGYIKSFHYNKNKLYHIYNSNDKSGHCSAVIYMDNFNNVKLIESSFDGNIRIWNFHSGLLFNKIGINIYLYGICLWNKEYLFFGSRDKKIRILELNSGKIIRELSGHNNRVLCVKIIDHPEFGDLLISQEFDFGDIKICLFDN